MPTNQLPIVIQPRDMVVLRGLLESRIMTLGHIAAIHFDGRSEAAKKRLQKLKAAAFVDERRRRVNEPAILFLTRKAFRVLDTEGILSEYPPLGLSTLEKRTQIAESTIRHELEVMDIKAAMIAAFRAKAEFLITEFSTWPSLNEFRANPPGKAAPRTIQPDGFMKISEQQNQSKWDYTFFLEHDRSNESQDVLALKCASYADYYRTGGFAVKNGAERSEYGKFPFRVLVVLKTAERRNNTAEKLLQMNPPIFTQVYLSTFNEVKADPLGAIWIRPLDYRDVTKGTAFDPGQKRETWGYKRQSDREMLVEGKIKKHRLLVNESGV